jgi:hypothetical protein
MFLELNRMKEEVTVIKTKTGISTNVQGNQINAGDAREAKIVLGNNAGLGGGLLGLKDGRRLEASISSNASSFFDQTRNNRDLMFRMPVYNNERQLVLANR